MRTTSISRHPGRVRRNLAAALLVGGLQLSLVALPIGSLRAGEDEQRMPSTGKICRVISEASPIARIRIW